MSLSAFETSSNLSPGDSWTSLSLQLLSVSTFVVQLSSDVQMKLLIEISGDDTNWVEQRTYYGTTITENIQVKGAFTRLTISNISSSTSSYLRVFSYPSHQHIPRQVETDRGWPSIHIENLPKTAFGDITTSEGRLLTHYKWTSSSLTGAYFNNTSSTGLKTGYNSLLFEASNTAGAYAQISNTGVLDLCSSTGNTAGWSRIAGNSDLYQSGVPMTFRFTSVFYESTGGWESSKLGIGNLTNSSTKEPLNFIGLGISASGEGTGIFGIWYIRNSVETFIPQTSFSENRLDGNNKEKHTIDITKGNIWQIKLAYLGFSDIEIQNYIQGEFVTVHKLKFANLSSSTSVSDPSFRFIMQYEQTKTLPITPLLPVLGNASYGCLMYADYFTSDFHSYSRSQTITGGAETVLFALLNPSTWFSQPNSILCSPVLISIGCDGTKNTLLKIYGGSVGNTVLGGAWSVVEPGYSPVQANTSCTIASTARVLFQIVIDKTGKQTIDMNSFSFLANGNSCWLITCTSAANSDVISSLTWKEVH